MTLRRRLYIAVALVMCVFVVAGVLLINYVQSSEINQADQQLRTSFPALALLGFPGPPNVGAGLAVQSQVSVTVTHPASGSKRLKGQIGGVSNIKFISNDVYLAALVNGRRHVISSPIGSSGATPRIPSIASTPHSRVFQAATVGSRSGSGSWRAVLIREPGPSNEILVALSLKQIDATITRLRWAVIGGCLFVFLVLTAAGFWVARLGLRPIAEVTSVADGITAGDRSRRVTGLHARTEASHLARAFNMMLDEQQALENRLRQFVADASHELRTPLSVIQGLTGLWRQGDLREGAAGDDAMQRIGREGARMSRLVGDLLLLARLDEGRPQMRTTFDLALVVDEVIVDVLTTHPSRSIVYVAPGPVMIDADETALRRVIVNLVSNAVTHTPTTSHIEIRTLSDPGSTVLEVTDDGPGMDSEGVAHAFDRFWRADTSRARAGSGLGLSIVAGIVAAHGGTVELTSDPDSGTTVRIVLPS